MVLVQVNALVREDQIGHPQLLQPFEEFPDRGVLARKIAIAKAAEQQALPAGARESDLAISMSSQCAPTHRMSSRICSLI